MPIKSVFISHVTAEAAVAEALKRSLEQALDLSAFASSTDINLERGGSAKSTTLSMLQTRSSSCAAGGLSHAAGSTLRAVPAGDRKSRSSLSVTAQWAQKNLRPAASSGSGIRASGRGGDWSTGFAVSFTPQCDDRISMGRPSSRSIACDQGGKQKEHRYG
jgi:hypothetical protein